MPEFRRLAILTALAQYRRGSVCSALARSTIHRRRFCQVGIWRSSRSRYRPDSRYLLTHPRGLGDCMNIASRLFRNPFAGSSDLGHNWIDHFNSPVNQMVCRSMVVPCLDLDTSVRSLGGAQDLRYACSSTSRGIVFHEPMPWRYGKHRFELWLVFEVRPKSPPPVFLLPNWHQEPECFPDKTYVLQRLSGRLGNTHR